MRPERDVLLVEDDDGDVELLKTALERAKAHLKLRAFADVPSARRALAADPRPDLVVLDINLPGDSGFVLLRELKADERLRAVPVVMWSTSDAPRDIALSYELGAACYLVKPGAFDGWVDLAGRFSAFWLDAVRLPPHPGAS